MGDLTRNFSIREFKCPCGCGFDMPALYHVDNLQELRDAIGKPITIASGNRCPVYNRKVGGAAKSRHMNRDATDIIVVGMTPQEVMKYAEKIGPIIARPNETKGFGGLGVGVTRIHVDSRPRKHAKHKYPGARALWTYSNVKYDWAKWPEDAA